MTRRLLVAAFLAGAALPFATHAFAGQAALCRVRPAVIDPAANKLLGVIRLGDPEPANFSLLRWLRPALRRARSRRPACRFSTKASRRFSKPR